MAATVKAIVMTSGGLDSTLAAKVLLEQGIQVDAVTFTSPQAPRVLARSGIAVDMTGLLDSSAFRVAISNHMEYDGCMRIAMDIVPARAVSVDHFRVELPFRPERA